MIPIHSKIGQGMRIHFERLVNWHGENELIPVYLKNNIFNFYLNREVKSTGTNNVNDALHTLHTQHTHTHHTHTHTTHTHTHHTNRTDEPHTHTTLTAQTKHTHTTNCSYNCNYNYLIEKFIIIIIPGFKLKTLELMKLFV